MSLISTCALLPVQLYRAEVLGRPENQTDTENGKVQIKIDFVNFQKKKLFLSPL